MLRSRRLLLTFACRERRKVERYRRLIRTDSAEQRKDQCKRRRMHHAKRLTRFIEQLTPANSFCRHGTDGSTALTDLNDLRQSGSGPDDTITAASGICPKVRMVSFAYSNSGNQGSEGDFEKGGAQNAHGCSTVRRNYETSGPVTWLRLSEATVIIDHDMQKARERLERAIKKAWLVRAPGLPQSTRDPNVPLRIQVTPPPGLRSEGRGWLDNPVLHWEASEIECLCKTWTPSSKALASELFQSRVKIEIWDGDLVRLWGSCQEAHYALATMS